MSKSHRTRHGVFCILCSKPNFKGKTKAQILLLLEQKYLIDIILTNVTCRLHFCQADKFNL